MCGIAGIVGRDLEPGTAERMASRLRHRGPDDFGVWSGDGAQLGHTRLAILDPTPAGHQPMQLGPLVLAYNGEIYNHVELRRTLETRFSSGTDSETLLHLFDANGIGSVPQLTGMFAFAVWNEARRELVLARDRLGIKPLYYWQRGTNLAFASELKALLTLGVPTVDRGAIRDLFAYGHIPAPKSAYCGIAKLPAAHTLVWRDGRVEIARYWTPRSSSEIEDPRQAAEGLDALLRTVVTEHQMSDVPTGVFLSGGIDSATLVSFLDHPRTFTLGFDVAHRDESPAARRVADHFATEHFEGRVKPADIENALAIIPRIFDEPFGDSAAWSNWEVARMARRHVTVALSGEGGDELFLGYQRHGKMLQREAGALTRLAASVMPPLTHGGRSLQRRAASGFDRYAILSGQFTPRQLRELLDPDLLETGGDDPAWAFRAAWRDDLEPCKAMQWMDLHTTLPDGILTKVDRTSMDHALEVRPPLLDHRVVEFALSLAPDLLRDTDGTTGKLVLRTLMESRLPAGHLDLRKSGFNLPIMRWIRKQPQTLESALDRLADHRIIRRPRRAEFGSEQIWLLLVLDRWLEAIAS